MSSSFPVESVLIPSGTFVFQESPFLSSGISQPLCYRAAESPLPNDSIQICNPMPRRAAKFTYIDESKTGMSDMFLHAYSKVPVIDEARRKSYADQVLNIGHQIAASRFDLIIVPLRGGLRPAAQLKVLDDGATPQLYLPFTAGSQQKNWGQITECLTEGLRPYAAQDQLRIGVVDTAISGHSARALAGLLKALHEVQKARQWVVTFHLLYDRTNQNHPYPKLTGDIEPMSSNSLTFAVTMHCVESLIVEDWNPAFGVKVNWGGETKDLIKPALTEGRLIVQHSDGTMRLVESPEVDVYFDTLVAESVSDQITNDPNYAYTADVWQRYINH